MVGVIPETVGHFTGITTLGDGGPERIYEHDIVWFLDKVLEELKEE
jgi:hypothetical protein